MRLVKLHGLQNDFLVALDDDPDRPRPGAAEARAWCDRHTGIGADGLMIASAPGAGTERGAESDVDVVMTLFNSDGTPAELSGNGIRCFAHAVTRARGITEGRLAIATGAGRRVVELAPGAHPYEVQVSVGMGMAGPGPEVPDALARTLADAGRRFGTASLGNPHLVVAVPDPWSVDLAVEGPAIAAAFTGPVNVEFIALAGDDHLDLTVWERGAGITRACGTGACAATSLARSWGLVDGEVTVTMPGGDARVAADGDGRLTLTGPSVWIADIEVADLHDASGDGAEGTRR